MHCACGISSPGSYDGRLLTSKNRTQPILSFTAAERVEWINYVHIISHCTKCISNVQQRRQQRVRGSIWEFSRSAKKALPEYFQAIKFSGESLVKTLQTLHLVHIPSSQCAFFGHFIFLLFDFSSLRYKIHADTSNSLRGRWAEVERWPLFEPCESDLSRFGSRLWTVRVLTETESHTVYIATIMGHINAFFFGTRHLNKSILDSALVFLWDGSKELRHWDFLTWFLTLLNSVSKHMIWSDGSLRCRNTRARMVYI